MAGKPKQVILSGLLFSLAGCLGACLSTLFTYFMRGMSVSFRGNAYGILDWGLWPAKIFGMGLGELSWIYWTGLMFLNLLAFGVLGVFAGLASHKKTALLTVYFLTVAVIVLWCTWLTGFAIDGGAFASTVFVIFFYSVPFALIAHRNQAP